MLKACPGQDWRRALQQESGYVNPPTVFHQASISMKIGARNSLARRLGVKSRRNDVVAQGMHDYDWPTVWTKDINARAFGSARKPKPAGSGSTPTGRSNPMSPRAAATSVGLRSRTGQYHRLTPSSRGTQRSARFENNPNKERRPVGCLSFY